MNWLKRFFRRLWGQESSRSVAKSRLKMILIHDRADIPPGLLEEIKDEIIALIATKLTIDAQNVVVNLSSSKKQCRLVAEIPLETGSQQRQPASQQLVLIDPAQG